MFRWYGLLGALMIAFAELNFILKIEPFAHWYFPIVWFGYILVIDSIVYKLRKHSLIHNKPKLFALLMLLSASIWWLYEIINSALGNWNYQLDGGMMVTTMLTPKVLIAGTICFSTVLPAFFETYELFKSLNLFSHAHLRKKHKITKGFLFAMVGFGIFCLAASILASKVFYMLIWPAFFFILDPINYLHKQPSIIGHLKDRKLQIPVTAMLTGLLLGFFWEFWNYWAAIKWTYHTPGFEFWKIFEMPALGYVFYLPFGLTLYSMYYFVRSLFYHKTHILARNI